MNRGDAATFVTAVVREVLGVGCRDWPGGVTSQGRPAMKHEGRWRLVTHVVLEEDGWPRPPGRIALHTCDRPICVAPWHLRWGTHLENSADAKARGRHVAGETVGGHRLTVADVAWIRTCGLSLRAMASRLGVGVSTVCEARSGVQWSSVTVPAPLLVGR